ncbi:hypothetical protein CSKR_112962 [Clonorchis sinensis]|uniref:Negative elongation factor E n=2 Tax=Clonorchis sinensis TaxID=79923 RepID=A0A8T1MHD8_CLOSI|nr:hypothetical protein CSKR_112962 [Clonorchis sinensis]
MACEDLVQELGKNVDTDELLSSFLVEMPRDYTEPEKALKKELATLRKMKRTLTEISQIKREEKPRATGKTGEKAKEEAMELLRSGAIHIADKKERHTFKRRPKDPEEEESGRTPVKSAPRDKQLLYGNFLRGPKLMPTNTEAKDDRSEEFSSKPPLIFDCSVSNLQYNTESLATKRKQQLLTLSEDEDEAGGNNTRSVTDAPADSGHSDESPRSSDTTLYVGYHKVTEGFIQKLLQPVGHIVRIKIGEHQNHAYVTMATHEMAQKALELDHQMVDNRLLRVGFARRQCSRPRRDPRPLGPFSPKSSFGRRNCPPASYNSLPPTEVSRDLVTYEDLDYGDQ